MSAAPLMAKFGCDTYALLKHCRKCWKPYSEHEQWHTFYTSTDKQIVWWLLCDECYQKKRRES